MERVKIALVGAGNRGRHAHLPVITRMDDAFELVAICDMDENKAKEVGEEIGVEYYENLEEMLTKAKPDIADICTPGDTHHEVAKVVAEHGVNIICETPIATTLAYADEMIDAAKKASVKLEVAENVYRFPNERMKVEIIKSKTIGKVLRTYNHRSWGGYHAMNALRAYADFREVKSVQAFRTSSELAHPIVDREPTTTESWVHAIIRFEDDIIAIYEMLSPRYSPLRRRPHTQVEGSAGSIVDTDVHLLDGTLEMKRIRNDQGALEQIVLETDPKVVWSNPFTKYGWDGEDRIAVASELWSIRKAVLEDVEPEYGAENARKDQEISIAIGEACRTGQIVQLPLKT